MEPMTVTLIIAAVVAGALTCSYLDAKYQWRLTDWLNGQCNNPFIAGEKAQLQQQLTDKDARIDALSKRIATLEAIVTEPGYELQKQIDAL